MEEFISRSKQFMLEKYIFLVRPRYFETILVVEKVQIWQQSIFVVYNIGPY